MIILSDLCGPFIIGGDACFGIIKEGYGKAVMRECYAHLGEVGETYKSLMRGEITEDAFWQEFYKGKNWPFNKDLAKEMLSEALTYYMPGTLELLKSIVAYPHDSYWIRKIHTGVPPALYIASNFSHERIAEVRQYHPEVFEFAKDTYWSCDLGITKDSPEFFERVLWDLKAEPSEILFIDDNRDNIMAASEVGIAGILFTDVKNLKKCLTRHGFEFADKKAS